MPHPAYLVTTAKLPGALSSSAKKRISSILLTPLFRSSLMSVSRILDQTKLYMRDNAPVAYVSWAKLSDTVAERYCGAPHQLTAGDWQSGDQIWIVDLYAPFGGATEVLQDLRETALKGQAIHQLTLSEGAKLVPTVLNAATDSKAESGFHPCRVFKVLAKAIEAIKSVFDSATCWCEIWHALADND